VQEMLQQLEKIKNKDLTKRLQQIDKELEQLEISRDLTQTFLHVDMDGLIQQHI